MSQENKNLSASVNGISSDVQHKIDRLALLKMLCDQAEADKTKRYDKDTLTELLKLRAELIAIFIPLIRSLNLLDLISVYMYVEKQEVTEVSTAVSFTVKDTGNICIKCDGYPRVEKFKTSALLTGKITSQQLPELSE